MKLDQETVDLKFNAVKRALYNSQFQEREANAIKRILAECPDNHEAANQICEYLVIQKRYNRTEIRTALNNVELL